MIVIIEIVNMKGWNSMLVFGNIGRLKWRKL